MGRLYEQMDTPNAGLIVSLLKKCSSDRNLLASFHAQYSELVRVVTLHKHLENGVLLSCSTPHQHCSISIKQGALMITQCCSPQQQTKSCCWWWLAWFRVLSSAN